MARRHFRETRYLAKLAPSERRALALTLCSCAPLRATACHSALDGRLSTLRVQCACRRSAGQGKYLQLLSTNFQHCVHRQHTKKARTETARTLFHITYRCTLQFSLYAEFMNKSHFFCERSVNSSASAYKTVTASSLWFKSRLTRRMSPYCRYLSTAYIFLAECGETPLSLYAAAIRLRSL